VVAQGRSDAGPFALKDGDRVVFYGDSITAQRLYTRFAEDFVVSRYPQMRVSFYNAGVSGDTVSGGHAGDMETRVKRDVAPWHPTVVTIMLGMNDGRYTTEYEANFKAYADGYRKLIANLRASLPGVRLFLIEPSPYDEVGHPSAIAGYNTVMVRYGEFVKQLGKEEGIPVIDFNTPMMEAVEAGMRVDAQLSGSLLPDRIHPSPAGHWIMAAALAKGWGLDPVVSSVTLHADGTVADAQNTKISGVHCEGDKLAWTQLDGAVPLPLELNDTVTQFVLNVSDLSAMDRQMLRVRGLTAPRYTLSVDGQKVGSYTAEQLNQGVNLALAQTPMEQGAKAVDWTSDDRAKLSGTRFDLLTEKAEIPEREAGVQALDALDRQLMAQEYQAAQPRSHSFELVPEKP
jgi:lysophospholipase L1-like esterase